MRTIASLIAFFFPLVIFVLTLGREITFTDSGELAAAATTLGIAHPPGYPLFTLVGRLFCILPVSTLAFRVGLVSACSAALTSLLIYLIGYALLRGLISDLGRRAGARRSAGGPSPSTRATESASRSAFARVPAGSPLATAMGLAPLAGALLFAFSRTPWSQAVVIEVYALQALLVTAFLAAAYRAMPVTSGSSASRPRTRYQALLGFTFGLALTNHLTGVLLFPALALALFIGVGAHRRARASVRVPLLATIGAAAFPLLLYIYLPLRSRLFPSVNWNCPETLQGFLVHVTARQYHGMFGSKGIRGEELWRFLTGQLPGEATGILIALAAVGLAVLLLRRRHFGIVTAVSAVAFVIYNMGYPIHDIDLYYVPTLAIIALWAAVGAGTLAWLAGRLHRMGPVVVALLLSLSSLLPLTAHWRDNDQHDFRLIACYLRDTLKYLDPNAVLFTGRWDTVGSPALYYQTVEDYRSDVVILDMGRLTSPVLERELSVKALDLVEACRPEIAAVAEIARLAERGETYDVGEGRRRFQALLKKLATEATALRPTYVTGDLHRRSMFAGFNLITEGLVSRVTLEDTLRSMPLPEFEGPGIRQAEIRNARERGIFLEYSRMLENRASVLTRHGKREEAARFMERARELSR